MVATPERVEHEIATADERDIPAIKELRELLRVSMPRRAQLIAPDGGRLEELRRKLTFIPVDDVSEVLDHALTKTHAVAA